MTYVCFRDLLAGFCSKVVKCISRIFSVHAVIIVEGKGVVTQGKAAACDVLLLPWT